MEQDEVIEETTKHILNVATLMYKVIKELANRVPLHDISKLGQVEFPGFAEFTPKLKGSTYGSEEYKKFLGELKPTLDHHYKVNRHHPEHFSNGVQGMNLVDVIEMFCDWCAATKRHDSGDINQSIDINQKRFNYSYDLKSIFRNTAELLEGRE